jgi:hypothetical protein
VVFGAVGEIVTDGRDSEENSFKISVMIDFDSSSLSEELVDNVFLGFHSLSHIGNWAKKINK